MPESEKNYLGIDWGATDVGVALAHAETCVAMAYATLANDKDLLQRLAEIIEREDLCDFVRVRNRAVLADHAGWLADLPPKLSIQDLHARAGASGAASMSRPWALSRLETSPINQFAASRGWPLPSRTAS